THDRFSCRIERCIQQNRNTAAPPERLEQSVQSWRHLAFEDLRTGRPIDVRDRREPVSPLRSYRKNARHEPPEPRSSGRQVEIAVRHVDRDHRGEWPELFAVLDVAVEPVAHYARVWSGQDAAMAKSTRAELAGAIHPADDPAGGELVGGAFYQGRVVQLLDRLPVLPRRSCQLPRVHWWAPERMV